MYWHRQNKKLTSFKMVVSFICPVPVRLLLPRTMAVLCCVNDLLQRGLLLTEKPSYKAAESTPIIKCHQVKHNELSFSRVFFQV